MERMHPSAQPIAQLPNQVYMLVYNENVEVHIWHLDRPPAVVPSLYSPELSNPKFEVHNDSI